MGAMSTIVHPVPEGDRPLGFGDGFAKLLLVSPDPGAEPRLFRALHVAGVAARSGGRDDAGQKLFGARIVGDPTAEWPELRRWVRAVVAFGPEAWAATLDAMSMDGPTFAPGNSVSDGGVTILGHPALDDPEFTDAALADALSTAQDRAGLTWGCGGSSVPRNREAPPALA